MSSLALQQFCLGRRINSSSMLMPPDCWQVGQGNYNIKYQLLPANKYLHAQGNPVFTQPEEKIQPHSVVENPFSPTARKKINVQK